MRWLRLYHDAVTDPKWRLVAIDSGQPLSAVLAVWMSMLVCASQAGERGTLEGWDDRVSGAAIDLRADAVRCIREAMQGLVLDGMRLTGWDKRQRASDDIAQRVKRHRNKGDAPTPGGGPEGVNGHHYKAETLPTGDVTLHSDPVTEKPLRAQSQTQIRGDTEGEEDDARAPPPVISEPVREVAVRVAEMAGIVGDLDKRRDIAVVAGWLKEGADPEIDIFPVVADVLNRTKQVRIRTFGYFTEEITNSRRARLEPKGDKSNVEHIRKSRKPDAGERNAAILGPLARAYQRRRVDAGPAGSG